MKANLITRLRNVFTDELFDEEAIQDTYGTGYESGQKELAEIYRKSKLCRCSVCWPGGGIDYAAATEDSPLTGSFASEQRDWWEEGGDE